MTHIIPVLVPIFSLILIGYFFKKIKFPSYEFWPMADKLTYYILMPSLLIYKLSNANLSSQDSIDFILTTMITLFVILFILIILNKIFNFNGAAFTSIVQGGIRFNTYVFLALADSIFGNDGLILAAILLTFAIPIINVMCITIFALYVNDNKLKFIDLIRSIITNPLIIACSIGGLLSFFQISMPIAVNKIFFILSQAALPMGLLSVGFGLVIKEIKSNQLEIFISSFAKLVLFPLVIYFVGIYFELNVLMISILIIFATLPTAPSSFVLARQLKGDIGLMSSIITIQTIASIFIIILALEFLKV